MISEKNIDTRTYHPLGTISVDLAEGQEDKETDYIWDITYEIQLSHGTLIYKFKSKNQKDIIQNAIRIDGLVKQLEL